MKIYLNAAKIRQTELNIYKNCVLTMPASNESVEKTNSDNPNSENCRIAFLRVKNVPKKAVLLWIAR